VAGGQDIEPAARRGRLRQVCAGLSVALAGAALLGGPSQAPAAQGYHAECETHFCGGVSEDGTRAIFPFAEELTPGAEKAEVYERAGGVTKALILYPANPPKPTYAALLGISSDARHVFVWTNLALTSSDRDGNTGDVYDISGGRATLLSTGPLDDQSSISSGPGAPFMMFYEGASADGQHVFLDSLYPVVPADTDGCVDVYERFGEETRLVSTGPTASPSFPAPNCDLARYDGLSADGSHVFFSSYDHLVPEDEGGNDIYQRVGDTVSLLTTYPGYDGNCIDTPQFGNASADGHTVLFSTNIRVSPEDHDRTDDVYKREPDGAFVLVSRGTEGPPVGQGCAMFEGDTPVALSANGLTAIFETTAALSPEDRDSASDLYSTTDGGPMSLVTTGPTDPNSNERIQRWAADVSDDASHVAFETDQQLVPEDTDHSIDVYLRVGDRTELVSTGPTGGNGEFDATLLSISGDGQTVAFATKEQMNSEDTDHRMDFYVRQAGGVRRPAGSASASKQTRRRGRTVLISAESIAPRMRIAPSGRLRNPHRAEVRLACPKTETSGPCHGKLTLEAAGNSLGRAGFQIRSGHRGWVTVKVGGIIDPGRSVDALARVKGVDRLGNAKTLSRHVVLRPAAG
jgi:hypothetical protein